MAGPNWSMAPDRKSVTITFPTNPPVALQLDLAGVEDVLKNLGEFRAGMEPEVTRSSPAQSKVAAVPAPQWFSEPDAMQGHSLLHIRDPRYGWLHYLIPPQEAAKLAGLLQTQADQAGQAAAASTTPN